jgi:hypothetical protein
MVVALMSAMDPCWEIYLLVKIPLGVGIWGDRYGFVSFWGDDFAGGGEL